MSKKQEIMDETVKLFAQHGYNLSLSQITDIIGLKKQSIYNYFSSKDELIIEMLKEQIENYYLSFSNCIASSKNCSPKEKLFNITQFMIRFFSDKTNLRIRKWIALSDTYESLVEIRVLAEDCEKKFVQLIREIIQEEIQLKHIKNCNIEMQTTFYVILIRGFIDGLLIPEKTQDDEILEEIIFNYYWNQFTCENK